MKAAASPRIYGAMAEGSRQVTGRLRLLFPGHEPHFPLYIFVITFYYKTYHML